MQEAKPTLRLLSTLTSNSVFLLGALILASSGFSQNCQLSLSGTITDEHRGTPISDANVWIQELARGTLSGESGEFSIDRLCPGEYHLIVSHFGCATQEHYINLTSDKVLELTMDHSGQFLDEVLVAGSPDARSTQSSQSLNQEVIGRNADANLAALVSRMPGVSSIKNGTSIAKPVIHGLYGNRISILNNGVPQSGQQWGQDHSPEIDPLVANTITVVKGVGAVEFLGNSLGGVILVGPRRIPKEPHLHGKVRYHFESNGLGHGTNFQLQKYSGKLGWRIIGTLSGNGDRSSADYYLRNTGARQGNLALQLEMASSDKWSHQLYMSTYNAELGILRGSHIGNLTDLQDALGRDVPFFTQDKFSNKLDAPRQQVNHHLAKYQSKLTIGDKRWLRLVIAGQFNQRKEFDVRRSGRTDIPALSIDQISTFGELIYQQSFKAGWKMRVGTQLNRVDNENDPETGILPLIPDYITYEYGGFVTMSQRKEKLFYEFGARFDQEDRRIAAISTSLPYEILRFNKLYGNASASAGAQYSPTDHLELNINVGLASRAPEVNELYSNGLHQGVSGIELGNTELTTEQSIKLTAGADIHLGEKVTLYALGYVQSINDYIFLQPQDEIRLTIRGAFPVFAYTQTDAQLTGADAVMSWELLPRLSVILKYAYLQGKDLDNDLSLINMPSNRLSAELHCPIGDVRKWENLELELRHSYVFQRDDILEEQDFVLPPDPYQLIDLVVSVERQFQKFRLTTFLAADNLLNTPYRDYLNRLRYFADDLGINVKAGISISF